MGRTATERVRRFYERNAAAYDHWLRLYDRRMHFDAQRHQLISSARGMTLEVGVGTGLNLSSYAPDVELSALDVSPAMLDVARRRAEGLALDVDFVVGDAEALPFADCQFDTVTATLLLSSVPDIRRAVAEIERVLQPGGVLLVLDHVRSDVWWVGAFQRMLDPLVGWVTGWHPARAPATIIRASGLTIESKRRSQLGMLEELRCRKRPIA